MKIIPKVNLLTVASGVCFVLWLLFKLLAAKNGLEIFLLLMGILSSSASIYFCIKVRQLDYVEDQYKRDILLLAFMLLLCTGVFIWLAIIVSR